MFYVSDFVPELDRSAESVVVFWSSLEEDDHPRLINFIDLSDLWTDICIIMREAYLDTYSRLFAKSMIVN